MLGKYIPALIISLFGASTFRRHPGNLQAAFSLPLNVSIRGPQYLKRFGFPIKDFGNDGGGGGFPIKDFGNDERESSSTLFHFPPSSTLFFFPLPFRGEG